MNEIYLKRMQEMLKDEYPAYLAMLDQPARRGFRVNPLKCSEEKLFAEMNLSHEKSPFASDSWYTDAEAGIGFTPEYLAGLFYMQEPSASSAVALLRPVPGMKVLDLCAAPGSKTTQIAGMLGNDGLLVANEYNANRAKVLVENIERYGAANVVVINADTKDVADAFEGYFDAVLCDAPCSGEGMMRRESVAVSQWSEELVSSCAALQSEILDNAYRCLKHGGVLVYSTCTFSMEEDEEQALAFLQRHPDMKPEEPGVDFGRPSFAIGEYGCIGRRIFPMDGGEGHFAIRFRKEAGEENGRGPSLLKGSELPAAIRREIESVLVRPYPYYFVFKDRVYGGVEPFIQPGRCRLMRHQVLIGEIKNGRFEFSHHFFMSAWSSFRNTIELNEDEVYRYLHGEQIAKPAKKGWYAVCMRGHVLGGARSDGKALKNRYPKHLRIR